MVRVAPVTLVSKKGQKKAKKRPKKGQNKAKTRPEKAKIRPKQGNKKINFFAFLPTSLNATVVGFKAESKI
jgi:hypothetical protein